MNLVRVLSSVGVRPDLGRGQSDQVLGRMKGAAEAAWSTCKQEAVHNIWRCAVRGMQGCTQAQRKPGAGQAAGLEASQLQWKAEGASHHLPVMSQ